MNGSQLRQDASGAPRDHDGVTVAAPGPRGGVPEVFFAFLRLGLTSFGGPIAHLGYFRAEFVEKRRWLGENAYAELVAISQFLPGPASSQTGFGLGLLRAGLPGALAAWTGFTLPSALLMFAFALGAGQIADTARGAGLLHGLKLVAVAIVAQAVAGMARTLCPDRARAAIAVAGVFAVLLVPGSPGQIAAILTGAALGLLLCRGADSPGAGLAVPVSRTSGAICLAAFFVLLAIAFLPLGHTPAGLVAAFYRAGALVFGGGHVVLPLLRDAVVAPGWTSDASFLAGYGAAQALPGPLFTFAAYLGAVSAPGPRWLFAGAALIAIFLPGVLALVGALPFWQALRSRPRAQAAMAGVNAAVVGLLASALYTPVWTSAVRSPIDFAVAAAAFAALVAGGVPPILVVLACGAVGAALAG
ncbi:MAG: chromate efflux transporter [Hyphomicrobiales bacterium]|nr:chromate efflux transporter [Hyphomicrobiales bacterium]